MLMSHPFVSAWEATRHRLQWVQRLRTGILPAFAFATLAILCRNLEALPHHIDGINSMGAAAFFKFWLFNNFAESIVIATVLLLSLRLSSPSGTELARRPLRFFSILILGGTAAAFIGREIGIQLHSSIPWYRFYEGWIATLLWGGLFGWIYVLYLQRREDQLRLATILGQRSLLTRLLAQSQVAAARAQIEPDVVVRMLRVIHQRYNTAPDDAAILMDHLINYLRLVLNRVREQRPLLVNELTLIRSYLALHEAETGRNIPFEATITQNGIPAESSFVIVRKLIRASIALPDARTTLRLTTDARHIAIDLGTGTVPLEQDHLAHISAQLAEAGTGANILHHGTDPHSHWYRVHVPIR